jgi:hypothetical protein
MSREISVESLWDRAPAGERVFSSAQIAGLPAAARRYLQHAIAPGARLAAAVRLRMHGEIKLRRWLPFQAEQVISRDRGMIWQAAVRMHGLPIRGSDRLVDGKGSMRWNLFGIIPVMTASGADVTRSAAGRVGGESIWLPSVLCEDTVSWSETSAAQPHASFTVHGVKIELDLTLDGSGRLKTAELPRWGNPEGAGFHSADFGVMVEEEKTFDGYTIPTRLRAGWYFAGDRFAADGEFFRATIDSAEYR